jgi:hypothetical protein
MGNRGKDSDLGINRKKEFLIHRSVAVSKKGNGGKLMLGLSLDSMRDYNMYSMCVYLF